MVWGADGMSGIELLSGRRCAPGQLRAAVFDFDGTLSTLRHGWEAVMRALMLECIGRGGAGPALEKEVDDYIDQSTGIQTVYQMQWLADRVRAAGHAAEGRDLWWYKEEYNRRLMEKIASRIREVTVHPEKREEHTVKGSEVFLSALREKGIELYLASGTDHEDVAKEADALGLAGYFTLIRGAPSRQMACSKEKVIRLILQEKRLEPESLLIVGDGKVEISLGASFGAFTLGVASNEETRRGVNEAKRARLIKAGADVLTGDFSDTAGLLRALSL